MTHRFSKSSVLPVSAHAAFDWHERPGAFERLNPPWEPVEVVEKQGGIKDGASVKVRIPAAPLIRIPAEFRHQNYQYGTQFQDIQARGPFAQWTHTHRFQSLSTTECRLEDDIEFKLPLEPLSALGVGMVKQKLERVFTYRHRITSDDLAMQQRYPLTRPLTIAITGASGLVGSALIPLLQTAGHRVLRFVRRKGASAPDTIYWDPVSGAIEREKLEGLDAVINLAGENITSGRWTEARKQLLWDSRVRSTNLLSETFAALSQPPKVFVSTSAIGFYGDRGEERCTESSAAGQGFLVELSQAWESAALRAKNSGIRVVLPRISIVLSARGGALGKMLPAFKAGVGGPLGHGQQYMSWIELNDLVRLLYAFVVDGRFQGAVNCAAGAATNREFSKTLGKVLSRPVLFPVPAPVLRLALGEMADAALLSSTRVESEVLASMDYRFDAPTLESALRLQLGRT